MKKARELKSSKKSDLSLSDAAYRQLRLWIREHAFRPGERLREADLADQMAMSRTPVREAIRRLVSEGLVQNGPSGGLVITALDKAQVQELYGLREILEGAAAEFAAKHATEAEIAEMRDVLVAFDQGSNSDAGLARVNLQFHALIYEAAHNRYISRALAGLANSLSLLPGTTFQVPGRTEAAKAEHAAIVDAIERRNSTGASKAAREHIRLAGLARRRLMFNRTED